MASWCRYAHLWAGGPVELGCFGQGELFSLLLWMQKCSHSNQARDGSSSFPKMFAYFSKQVFFLFQPSFQPL